MMGILYSMKRLAGPLPPFSALELGGPTFTPISHTCARSQLSGIRFQRRMLRDAIFRWPR